VVVVLNVEVVRGGVDDALGVFDVFDVFDVLDVSVVEELELVLEVVLEELELELELEVELVEDVVAVVVVEELVSVEADVVGVGNGGDRLGIRALHNGDVIKYDICGLRTAYRA
jgi:hypothetical protein